MLDTVSFEARDHTLLVMFLLDEAVVVGLLKLYRYIVLLMVKEQVPSSMETPLLMALLGFSLSDIHLGDC